MNSLDSGKPISDFFRMRLLKFFSAFLVTAILVFAFIFGLNWKSFSVFMENREAMAEGSEWIEKTYSLRGLSEFIDENPDHISVASIVIEHPDSSIYFRADTPRAMGTGSNFLILVAYAMEMDEGTVAPDDPIRWSDVNRYQIPDVESSIHRQAEQEASRRGWLSDDMISTEHALALLAELNDLALADYLWWNLDNETWNRLIDTYSLEQTQMPLPFSGLYLAISPGIQDQSAGEIYSEWEERTHDEWRDHVTELSRRYADDEEFRENVRDYTGRNRLGNSFMEERDALALFPQTTAREMAALLQSIWTEDTGEQVTEWMRWPMKRQTEIRRNFDDYGAVFDNRLGLLNGIDFGTSTYTGDTTVQAVFFDRLPIAFWFHMSSNHMHQDFQQRLIYDPAMIERMKRVEQRHHELAGNR